MGLWDVSAIALKARFQTHIPSPCKDPVSNQIHFCILVLEKSRDLPLKIFASLSKGRCLVLASEIQDMVPSPIAE